MDKVAENPPDLALAQRQRIAKQVWLVGSQPCIQNQQGCDSHTIWIHYLYSSIQQLERISHASSRVYALGKFISEHANCYTLGQVKAKTCWLRLVIHHGDSVHGDLSRIVSNQCFSSRIHIGRQERTCRRIVLCSTTSANIIDLQFEVQLSGNFAIDHLVSSCGQWVRLHDRQRQHVMLLTARG